MQGVILAAGKGTRLHPITVGRSKAMVPILGKPIVERVMELLYKNGVKDYILVVSPDDRNIVRYFHKESTMDADIRFVYQVERKGMANALQYAAPLIDGDFILSACDNLVAEQDVGRLMTLMKSDTKPNGALTLLPVEPARLGSVGIVELDGPWVTRIVEKPKPEDAPSNISSIPLYAFKPCILDFLPQVPVSPRGEYELQDAIQMLINREGRVGNIVIERRLTLTNAVDLLALNREYLTHGDGGPQLDLHTVGMHTRLITPLCIEQGAIIGKHCTVGPNVYIEKNCRIGDGAMLRDAVVLRGVTVPDGMIVENQVLA
ncbi:MAG: sugar phosphate nucleotidyltransferase [Anaerolineae bacterium]|nr:sugar phosphate nucleotidyltransferase [Anaerolineae bacterium]